MKKGLFTSLLFILFTVSLLAQDSIPDKKASRKEKNFFLENRHWTIGIPIWIPRYAGLISYGDVELEGEDGVDPEDPIEPPPSGNIGKILSRIFQGNLFFKFIYLGHIGYENKGFLVHLDGFGGSIGTSIKFNYNNKEVVAWPFKASTLDCLLGTRS